MSIYPCGIKECAYCNGMWWEDDDDGPDHQEGHYVLCPFRPTPFGADAAEMPAGDGQELPDAPLKPVR